MQNDSYPIWHPAEQNNLKCRLPILEVKKAEGSYLQLKDRKIIDAISSWWCKPLGHQHPRLKKALKVQMNQSEHSIFANTTYDATIKLSQKLCQLTKNFHKIFYASDGSSAVEIALKMSLHARKVENSPRHQFLSLKNSYHGETIGALSVSDVGKYKKIYSDLLFPCQTVEPFYIDNVANAENHWQLVLEKLTPLQEKLTAIIVEPIVQGAAGMKIYTPQFLMRLHAWAKAHNIHLIADEIMTGIARTGKMFAYEYANISPDFLCLGKGLSGGWLPLSLVLTTNEMYELITHQPDKAFLHSHTYSGNVLAASVANEVLDIVREDNLCERANVIGRLMKTNMESIAKNTSQLFNVRQIGAIVAADLISEARAFDVANTAIKRGALLRPLGKTIYWLPPLNIEMQTLDELKAITESSIFASQ